MEEKIEDILDNNMMYDGQLNKVKAITELLNLFSVMRWVVIDKDNLPPVHTHVILYDDTCDNHRSEFVHEGVPSSRYDNWTHYVELKPPCA